MPKHTSVPKKIPNITVSSSGVRSKENYDTNGPITWYALRILKRHNLIPHAKPLPTQTTPKHLNDADIVVFMTDEQYAYAKSRFKFGKNSFEIWNIPDIDHAEFFHTSRDTDEMRIQYSEQTFATIKEKVDNLVKRLKK